MTEEENRQGPARTTTGVIEGIGAYLWWGVVTTLYFHWMNRTDSLELVAWRVLGGLPVMLLVIYFRGEFPALLSILRDRRASTALFLSGLFILINWFTFIYSVLNERITEASLGYYINPLVSVALGAIFLGERLRPVQWIAVGCAVVAVIQLTVSNGSLPWISLVLAFSFGGYGLVRKQVKAESEVGLCVEMLLLLLPMLALQLWLYDAGRT
ncbi:MAG: EamA family transporter RarD, partial [Planctomycetota bacterium]